MDQKSQVRWEALSSDEQAAFAGNGLVWLQELPGCAVGIDFKAPMWTIAVSLELPGEMTLQAIGRASYVHLAIDELRRKLNPVLRSISEDLTWEPL